MSQPPEYTEEELRALEAEMERITVDDVLLQTIVSLINLTARKAGVTHPPGEGPPPDWEQVRLGIEACRALLPLVEPRHAAQLGPMREGLSRLQVHYVQNSGAHPSIPEPGGAQTPPSASPPRPAQGAGRLWIPGQ